MIVNNTISLEIGDIDRTNTIETTTTIIIAVIKIKETITKTTAQTTKPSSTRSNNKDSSKCIAARGRAISSRRNTNIIRGRLCARNNNERKWRIRY